MTSVVVGRIELPQQPTAEQQAKTKEAAVQESRRTKAALDFAKRELKAQQNHLALEYIRRIEAGEFEGVDAAKD